MCDWVRQDHALASSISELQEPQGKASAQTACDQKRSASNQDCWQLHEDIAAGQRERDFLRNQLQEASMALEMGGDMIEVLQMDMVAKDRALSQANQRIADLNIILKQYNGKCRSLQEQSCILEMACTAQELAMTQVAQEVEDQLTAFELLQQELKDANSTLDLQINITSCLRQELRDTKEHLVIINAAKEQLNHQDSLLFELQNDLQEKQSKLPEPSQEMDRQCQTSTRAKMQAGADTGALKTFKEKVCNIKVLSAKKSY